MIAYKDTGAIFDQTKQYRYVLQRIWDYTLPTIAFIGLNPSTADERVDDPTIRKCATFSKSWGFGNLLMVNLFAYRATEPSEMMKASDPVGEENNKWILDVVLKASWVVACWGNDGAHKNRGNEVLDLLNQNNISFYHFGLNKTGEPKHPLYLKGTTRLELGNGLKGKEVAA